ncbi:hypothetical protein [Streptomyces sp. NBC_00212]|uniref:hypothetical protein n=1 Tax=Streptomyces sp. NBC_00212 TaxID=2975684 RepID=UPI00386990FF
MIDIPEQLVATQAMYNGAAGRAFIAALPERAAHFLGRWEASAAFQRGVAALAQYIAREGHRGFSWARAV